MRSWLKSSKMDLKLITRGYLGSYLKSHSRPGLIGTLPYKCSVGCVNIQEQSRDSRRSARIHNENAYECNLNCSSECMQRTWSKSSSVWEKSTQTFVPASSQPPKKNTLPSPAQEFLQEGGGANGILWTELDTVSPSFFYPHIFCPVMKLAGDEVFLRHI